MNGLGKEIWRMLIGRAIEIVLMDGYTIETAACIMARPNGLTLRQEERLAAELRKRFRGTEIGK